MPKIIPPIIEEIALDFGKGIIVVLVINLDIKNYILSILGGYIFDNCPLSSPLEIRTRHRKRVTKDTVFSMKRDNENSYFDSNKNILRFKLENKEVLCPK